MEIEISNISSYKFEEGYGKTYIILYLKGGKKISLDFGDRISNQEYILDAILLYITSYNLQCEENEIIMRKPVFIATQLGLIFIICLGIVWAFISIFLAIYHRKTIPFTTIGGISFFIQMLTLRQKALRTYKGQA